MAARDNVLVWVDLEMTGLDPNSCAIVEMAMILTDPDLKELAEPFQMTVWQPDSVLETMRRIPLQSNAGVATIFRKCLIPQPQ